MSTLTHNGGLQERSAYAPARQDTAGAEATAARIAMIKRACRRALVILLAAAALTGIVALKTAAYFWRFHY